MEYLPAVDRYSKLKYVKCGKSGLFLPPVSLGLWHNFGGNDIYENSRKMLWHAFDEGITHFDLANNYGPPEGSAESTLGKVLKSDFRGYRDELIISSKAGYIMWPGPYGDGASRKYLMSSIDQSLRRMKIDYVDIFYSHRPDSNTPIEETMSALIDIVRQGKAIYVGLSNYNPQQTTRAAEILRQGGVECLIHQPRYSMFDRWVEGGLLDVLEQNGIGCIVYSPLAQGLLSDRYLKGIPVGSRASKAHFLKPESITPEKLQKIKSLNTIAQNRGQSLAQMALAWVLKDHRVTSVLIGASCIQQIDDNLQALKNMEFLPEELAAVERIIAN
ncbi:MAG TPA: L-glyceraldehyde 3-phosphate reductase [Lentimicrobium sp.]|nr:L-glyceraldehyde 3-phosphate reductase [Lentimicrobium sp.]